MRLPWTTPIIIGDISRNLACVERPAVDSQNSEQLRRRSENAYGLQMRQSDPARAGRREWVELELDVGSFLRRHGAPDSGLVFQNVSYGGYR